MTAPAELGVAMLGYGFMGGAHSRALRALRGMEDQPAALPVLVSISGRDREDLERARARYGWLEATCDWREQVADPRVAIFDNTGPNAVHLEPCLEAIRVGKAVLCEKPLGRSVDDAWELAVAAARARVVNMCAFNLRFLPAVRLAHELIGSEVLGRPTHFRGRFLASSALRSDQRQTWRFRRESAGSGAVADLGSHLVDLARHLVGEPSTVSAFVRTWVAERDGEPVDVDDAFACAIEFRGGAIGTLEASRVAGGRCNEMTFQVDGTRGSLSFDVDRLNELELITTRKEVRRISVTDVSHPLMELWWPSPGHPVGWAATFAHELRQLLRAVAGNGELAPAADFEDGYRCAEVCAAVLRSAEGGARERVEYKPIA